jgi:hypothetical protein
MSPWEIVMESAHESIRRFRVPGGWLYQVQSTVTIEPQAHGEPATIQYGWHPPVFVPEVKS